MGILFTISTGCNKSSTSTTSDSNNAPKDTVQSKQNPPLVDAIQQQVDKIQAIKSWTEVKKKELMETTEGGEAIFHFLNGKLLKITTKEYGETFDATTEYYLNDDKLIYVYQKTSQYNQIIY